MMKNLTRSIARLIGRGRLTGTGTLTGTITGKALLVKDPLPKDPLPTSPIMGRREAPPKDPL